MLVVNSEFSNIMFIQFIYIFHELGSLTVNYVFSNSNTSKSYQSTFDLKNPFEVYSNNSHLKVYIHNGAILRSLSLT
jgi:hypothetical protein